MLISLLVTFLLALFAGAMVWLVFRTIRRKPPRYLIPAVVGATMLAYTIWNDYSWASRTAEALPAGVDVIERIEGPALWQPWTFLFPRADRMIAIDRFGILTNDRLPDHYLVELVLLEQYLPARRTQLAIDCANARQASIDIAALDAAAVSAANWAPMRRDATLYEAVCTQAAASSDEPLTVR